MEKKIPPLASKQLEEMLVPIDSLTPHPENYKEHKEDQLATSRFKGFLESIWLDKTNMC